MASKPSREKLLELLVAAMELIHEMRVDMAKDDHRRARVEDYLHDAWLIVGDE